MGVFNHALNEAKGLDVGDIVQIRDYGLDDPKLRIWNGSKGEVVAVNGNNVKVRITDIKGSNVPFSVKWKDRIDRALKQTLSLEIGEFIILRDN